jgi:uncharacterized protein YndB with AHSA1/START domain
MGTSINEGARVRARRVGVIDAPVEAVWAVLSDLQRWPDWNADVSAMRVEGPLAPGTRFRWKAGGMVIQSQLVEVMPPCRIVWTGRTLGLSAIHVWQLDPVEAKTQVTTEESFEGFLPRLLPGLMRRTLEKTLDTSIMLLREACER